MTNRTLPLFLALLMSAAGACAQETTPTPPVPTPTPAPRDASAIIMAPPARDNSAIFHEDSDGVNRTTSDKVIAALNDGFAKWTPPTPSPTPVASPVDLRDVDKPKNEIKRLPKFVVTETRPPIFRPRDLFTKEGQTDLSLQAHPGLLFGNFLGLNGPAAYQMALDEQRLTDMSDLSDTAHAMARGGDKAESSYILQESQDTFMRPGDDFGPVGLGTNAGGGGK
jgi:hypothetical protein